jgi:hypothetical protein
MLKNKKCCALLTGFAGHSDYNYNLCVVNLKSCALFTAFDGHSDFNYQLHAEELKVLCITFWLCRPF